jgi:hypothetical protein
MEKSLRCKCFAALCRRVRKKQLKAINVSSLRRKKVSVEQTQHLHFIILRYDSVITDMVGNRRLRKNGISLAQFTKAKINGYIRESQVPLSFLHFFVYFSKQ